MLPRYHVIPFIEEARDWLREHAVELPANQQPSRFPTWPELLAAVGCIGQFRQEVVAPQPEQRGQIALESEQQPTAYRAIIGIAPAASPDEPHGFWFDEAWLPLAVSIVHQLVPATGPMALLTAAGQAIWIDGSRDVAEILREQDPS